MKIPYLQPLALLTACISLNACTSGPEQYSNINSDKDNLYATAWAHTFGLIDPDQDWCTVASVTADIVIPEGASTVRIYNHDPYEGGHLIAQTSHPGALKLDVSEGANSVYVRITSDSEKLIAKGYCPIVDGFVDVSNPSPAKAPSRADGSPITYAHTPSYFDAMIVCEDLGSIGDTDFNDIILGLKHVSGDHPTLTIVPMAAGGTLASKILFSGEYIGEIHDLIEAGSSTSDMLNTSVNSIGSVENLNHIVIGLDHPRYENWTIAEGWSHINIIVEDKDETITITAPTQGNAPQMLCIGGDWFWPKEKRDILDAYKGFASWSTSAGATSWLGNWVDNLVVKWDVPGQNPDLPDTPDPDDPDDPVDTRMWFSAVTSDNSDYSVQLNGNATTVIASGEKYYIESPLTSCKNMFAVYSTSQAFIMNKDGNYVLGYPTVDNKITEITFSEGFDMSAVTSFAHMFDGCQSLTSVNVDTWTKPAAATDLTAMFHYCNKLTSLDLSGWDTSNVDEFFDIFGYCSSLRTLNLDGWSAKSTANLRRFLGNTTNLSVKCSSALESALKANETVGGTGTVYSRP